MNEQQDAGKHLKKAMQWCSRAEKCIADVKEKMIQWRTPEAFRESIIQELIDEGFINEERYAAAFANDRFQMSGWGRKKIAHALQQKNIPEKHISAALQRIEPEAYRQKAKTLMQRKKQQTTNEDPFKQKQKVFRFMASRGFETALIDELWEYIV